MQVTCDGTSGNPATKRFVTAGADETSAAGGNRWQGCDVRKTTDSWATVCAAVKLESEMGR